MSKTKGIISGLISSCTFGLIPLFALPLMNAGIGFHAVLSYRYFLAAFMLGIILNIKGISLRISLEQFITLCILSVFSMSSALLLFAGYENLSSGVATTIHFLYPVFVVLIMTFIFKEKSSWGVFMALGLSITGVAFLSLGESLGGDTHANPFHIGAVLCVIISALTYAMYIVGINKSRIRRMHGLKITFYIMLLGFIQFLAISLFMGNFQLLPDSNAWINAFLLALLPTLISNFTLIYAISNIGSIFTSVLGAAESVTAVTIGILVFHEPFSYPLIIGVSCVIAAVNISIIIAKKQQQAKLLANLSPLTPELTNPQNSTQDSQ